MSNVKVRSAHKAGRRTQVMMENFSDLAELANNKLIDKHIHTEHKTESLQEILGLIDSAIYKSEEFTLGPHLTEIMNKITVAANELQDYITELEKHHR